MVYNEHIVRLAYLQFPRLQMCNYITQKKLNIIKRSKKRMISGDVTRIRGFFCVHLQIHDHTLNKDAGRFQRKKSGRTKMKVGGDYSEGGAIFRLRWGGRPDQYPDTHPATGIPIKNSWFSLIKEQTSITNAYHLERTLKGYKCSLKRVPWCLSRLHQLVGKIKYKIKDQHNPLTPQEVS